MLRRNVRFAFLDLSCLTFGGYAVAEDSTDYDFLGRKFVAALNNSSPDERVALIKEIFAKSSLENPGADRLSGMFEGLASEFGAMKYHHSDRTNHHLHVFAQSQKNQQWLDFQIKLSEDEHPKLVQLVFVAEVTEPVALPAGDIDQEYSLQWLNEYVDKLVSENELSASVLVTQGTNKLFERYVGFADASKTTAVTDSTKFNLGSGNKMFTAVSILQLAEAGKLTLEDTLAQYFPNYPNQSFIHSAQIKHLLSHQSGLGDYWDDEYEKHWNEITKLEDILPFVTDDSVAFKPGTGFQYSNSGFILLGLIIEKVSGQNYFEYVRDHIYKPLGMTHSDSYTYDTQDMTLAKPLSRSENGWTEAKHGARGTSAGGGYSTPADMLLFATGLRDGTLIISASLKAMTTPYNLAFDPPFPYGYAMEMTQKNGKTVSYGHGGFAPGVNFQFRYFPDQDITLVMFCNQDNGAYDDLRKNIEKLITGER